ncbi:hypothetical protein AXF42_Ash006167 [Apostasia shenzhenica]|uniref:Uncharacterized protein n=1 Tax=Apostasia shenzhenica TaxID=1088818 RepID=A0A2I0B0F8_9ASPA|nr:hypothetical protein AXF42_Ash006167 [Apostasia shenzhenica]
MRLHELRRPFKRPAISDQQRRREFALLRQAQQRSDSQNLARRLASSVLDLPNPASTVDAQSDLTATEEREAISPTARDLDVVQASKLKGSEGRRWFSRQLMLPEWMIDVPPNLGRDW